LTLADAISDVAGRMSADMDSHGEFALFKVANKGNYYLFISDGVAGVTAGDIVVHLIGVKAITTVNLLDGNLAISA